MVNENMPPIQTKKQFDTSEEQLGTCKFCGQAFMIETLGMTSSEDLDERATEKCDCNESKQYINRRDRKKKACAKIEELFGEEGTITEILKANLDNMLDYKIATISIDETGYKAKMQMTSKGKIKIEKSISRKATMEA